MHETQGAIEEVGTSHVDTLVFIHRDRKSRNLTFRPAALFSCFHLLYFEHVAHVCINVSFATKCESFTACITVCYLVRLAMNP